MLCFHSDPMVCSCNVRTLSRIHTYPHPPALAMTHTPGDIWVLSAPKVPEGTRYRYFIRKVF